MSIRCPFLAHVHRTTPIDKIDSIHRFILQLHRHNISYPSALIVGFIISCKQYGRLTFLPLDIFQPVPGDITTDSSPMSNKHYIIYIDM